MEKHSLSIGTKQIDYLLQRKERKYIKINVLPDMSVEVFAPFEIQLNDVHYRVRKKATWILKQQRYFEQFHPFEPNKEFVSGETHKYLGRQYRLKVIESDQNNVKLIGKYLNIHSQDKNDNNLIENLLYQWYREKAKIKFADVIDKFLVKLSKYDLEEPKLTIRRMKSRWGSCNTKNQHILLNLELIKTPIDCIEYVVMHELSHLKYPNHTKDFYNFLSMMMPDWKKRKLRLEKAGQ